MIFDDFFSDDNDLEMDDTLQSDFSMITLDDDIHLSDNDDDFIDDIMEEYHHGLHNVTFRGHDTLPPNANSDGYMPHGHQELTSSVSELHKTFKLYTKEGHDYVLYNGHYYQVDGYGTVTIGGIKYNKI